MGKRWGAWYFAIAYAGYVRSATRIVLESGKENKPSEILHKVNEAVFNDERISEVFITLSVILIDRKNKVAKYSGAGDLPIVYKSDSAHLIHSTGLLLGFNKSGEYNDHEIKLNNGDEIYIVTDGIIEARNKNGEQYGHDRLLDFVNKLKPDEDPIEKMKKEIFEFTNGELEDDVSFIAIKMI